MPEANDDRVFGLEAITSLDRTPTRILVVGPERWWTASLVSVLSGRAFEVVTTTSSRMAERHVDLLTPHAVIVHNRLADGKGIDLVRKLRAGGFGGAYPIILCSEEHLGREERLEAVRAGAWDFLDLPLGYDEFLLKLDRFVGATRIARKVSDEFVDPVTGLYTLRGLLRFAQEMVHAAKRNRRPFGCVALAPAGEPTPNADESQPTAGDPAPQIAALLARQGRKSDIFGRIGPEEYVVLTPDTGPEGVVMAANRFIRGMAASPAPVTSGTDYVPLTFRAGCFAVTDVAAHALNPADVISRATLALRQGVQGDPLGGSFFVGAVGPPS